MACLELTTTPRLVSRLIYLLVSLGLFSSITPFLKAASQEKVVESVVLIPNYQSSLEFRFPTPQRFNALMVTYQQTSSCRGFGVQLFTASSGNPWKLAKNEGVYFYPLEQPLTALKLQFTSSITQRCLVNVWNIDLSDDDQGAPTRSFLGEILFKGGFEPNQRLEIGEQKELKKILIFIPSYCSQVELLEAIVNENFLDFSEKFAEIQGQRHQWYEILVQPPRKINSVKLSLSGPVGQVCELPVYGIMR